MDVGVSDSVSEAVRGFILGRHRVQWESRNNGGRYRLRGAAAAVSYKEAGSESEEDQVEEQEIVVPRIIGSVVASGSEGEEAGSATPDTSDQQAASIVGKGMLDIYYYVEFTTS